MLASLGLSKSVGESPITRSDCARAA